MGSASQSSFQRAFGFLWILLERFPLIIEKYCLTVFALFAKLAHSDRPYNAL